MNNILDIEDLINNFIYLIQLINETEQILEEDTDYLCKIQSALINDIERLALIIKICHKIELNIPYLYNIHNKELIFIINNLLKILNGKKNKISQQLEEELYAELNQEEYEYFSIIKDNYSYSYSLDM